MSAGHGILVSLGERWTSPAEVTDSFTVMGAGGEVTELLNVQGLVALLADLFLLLSLFLQEKS